MSRNIRIHELAKELGIESKLCIELCEELNIRSGATTSSSIPVAQADRIRARAKRDGLIKKAEAKDGEAGAGSGEGGRAGRAGRTGAAGKTAAAGRARSGSRQAARAEAARAERAARRQAAAKDGKGKGTTAAEPAEVAEVTTEELAGVVDGGVTEFVAEEVGTGTAETVGVAGEVGVAGDRVVRGDAGEDAGDLVAETAVAAEVVAGVAAEGEAVAKASGDSLVAEESVAGGDVASSEITSSQAVGAETETAEAVVETAVGTDTVADAETAADTEHPDVAVSEADIAATEDVDLAAETVADVSLAPATDTDATAEFAPQTDTDTEPAADPSPLPGTQPDTPAEVISSDIARETISSRPMPKSVSGKPIPPPPASTGQKPITVDGEAFTPGSRPPQAPPRGRRPAARRGAANVDAVFTPQQTRMPASAGKGKGRGSPAPVRTAQQRRRKGGRRRRRSVEELRPLEQQSLGEIQDDISPPEGVIEIERHSTAQEVAPKLNRTTTDMVKYFLDHQELITATQPLSDELIELYAEDIGAQVRIVDFEEEQEAELRKLLDLPEDLAVPDAPAVPRPPVVTIMGHVDHGKTTLLDAVRNSQVTAGEAGGITQHIGAYHVERGGQAITFIDTPGHEAFTAMRNRGANVTDIVVLVVAADDGLMPQTEEAINHAKAADVPIIVAINKTDLEGANPDRARQQLAERGLVPEAWGGETVYEEVSALQGDGLDELLESILLTAEVQELTAPVDQRSQGVVLESHKDIGRGPVATLLVKEGTLRVGDPVVAGAVWGKIRAMLDENGDAVSEAGPSMPTQVLGLSEVATAGDEFAVAPSLKLAEKISREREQRHRLSDLSRDIGSKAAGAKLEDIFASVSAGEAVSLNLVLKSDVNGSLEALVSSLEKLERENLKLSFVHKGVGGITENDVQLAAVSNATIIGFNVRPDSKARQLAAHENVEMRLYEVIYKVTEDVEAALLGMLTPEVEEIVTGEAEVREIFRIRRVGSVAGCYVRSGVVRRGSHVRFLRDGAVIWRGTIRTLKRFQEDVGEVASGFECGIGLTDFQDLKQGDLIETFEEKEIVPS